MVRVHASPRGYIRLSLVFYLLGIWFNGGLAQLARAPALHAGGHRFDSDILHNKFFENFNKQQYYVALNCTYIFNYVIANA